MAAEDDEHGLTRAAAAAALAAALLAAAGLARAHGSGPDLVAYCKSKHSTAGVIAPSWSVRYDAKQQRWTCVLSFPHFQQGTARRTYPLDVYDACWQQHRTPKAHAHAGARIADPRTVHCGIADGIVGAAGEPAVLKLCNESSTPAISAAIARWSPGAGQRKGNWTSQGWWRIERGKCATVGLGPGYRGTVYLHARSGSSSWGGGADAARFCVNARQRFTLAGADASSCNAPGFERVPMSRFALEPGDNRWRFR